ncbi:MAG: hypothetical protein MI867_30160, partial [Pseudomonadales bacterium]|nr:hypothetical protein [Pseudomonadales bacterium]
MKKQSNEMQSQFRPWQRITSCITLFFFLMQTSVSALAGALTNETIEAFLTYNSEFQATNAGNENLYEAAAYVVDPDPVGVQSIQGFYEYLKEHKPQNIDPPLWVPISVG